MKNYKKVKKIEEVLESITCDRCGLTLPHYEKGMFIRISHNAGYGSFFRDGNMVRADICEKCISETLGEFLTIIETS